MESESKNYEIAYLLHSKFTEEEALVHAQQITTLIEEAKGIVRHVEKPRPRRLAYVIKKEDSASFGWITFSLMRDLLPDLEKKIKALGTLLRFMIVEEEQIEVQRPRLRVLPTHGVKPATEQPVENEVAAGGEKQLDLESLDKKLEEILGK